MSLVLKAHCVLPKFNQYLIEKSHTHSFLFDTLSSRFMSFIAANAISKMHFSKRATRNPPDIARILESFNILGYSYGISS